MTAFYDEIMQTLDRLQQAPANPEFVALLEDWQSFFGALSNVTDQSQRFVDLASALAGLHGEPDPVLKLAIVQLAAANPVLGPAIVLASLPATTARWAGRFWQGLCAEEVRKPASPAADPNPHSDVQLSAPFAEWTIKSLPPPGPGRKYLIFSDVHRDDASDRRQPLEPGSIEHFSHNAALFARILDHVGQPASGYTILEGGDCEELWFIRSVDGDGATVAAYPKTPAGGLDVAAKLRSIIQTNQGIYDRLRALHQAGRYFRIQGNHDSWVRTRPPHDGSVFAVLEQAMSGGASPAFRIYDACVIPGVKTMCEHAAGELLIDAWRVKQGAITRDEFIARLLQSHLGLDAATYTDTAKMVVAHGHQFDFWNCEGNELAGLLISNTVATFLDRHMDRLLELRGIAWQGNPLVDFQDIFANLSVFSGWPTGSASVELAHRVQHKPNGQRVLTDDIFYCESIVALWAAFGIALSGKDAQGVERMPADSRAALDPSSPTAIGQYLTRHHFHHVCIGHTHVPHSQPFFTLENLAGLLPPPFSWLVRGLRAVLPEMLEPTLKTMYSNSGTAGWMEGVIWATEIDETGQSRLLYWTDKTRVETPERMDWELDALDPAIRSHLLEAYRAALDSPGAELSNNVAELLAALKARLNDLHVAADALGVALSKSIALPVHLLAIAFLEQAKAHSPLRKLAEIEDLLLQRARNIGRKAAKRAQKEVNEALDQAVDALRGELEKLRGFSMDVFLSLRRRTLRGFAAPADADFLTLQAPISADAGKRLLAFRRIIIADPVAGESQAQQRDREDAALHHAGLAFAMFDGFPRNLPFFANRAEASNPAARIHASAHPVLQSMLSTLWLYPVAGQRVEIGGVALWSRFALKDGGAKGSVVELTIKLGKAGQPEPADRVDGPLVA